MNIEMEQYQQQASRQDLLWTFCVRLRRQSVNRDDTILICKSQTYLHIILPHLNAGISWLTSDIIEVFDTSMNVAVYRIECTFLEDADKSVHHITEIFKT